MNKCPICEQDRDQPKPESLKEAMAKAGGVVREMVDPGGRAMAFGNGVQVRLSDMCNACDHRVLLAALGVKL